MELIRIDHTILVSGLPQIELIGLCVLDIKDKVFVGVKGLLQAAQVTTGFLAEDVLAAVMHQTVIEFVPNQNGICRACPGGMDLVAVHDHLVVSLVDAAVMVQVKHQRCRVGCQHRSVLAECTAAARDTGVQQSGCRTGCMQRRTGVVQCLSVEFLLVPLTSVLDRYKAWLKLVESIFVQVAPLSLLHCQWWPLAWAAARVMAQPLSEALWSILLTAPNTFDTIASDIVLLADEVPF